METPPLTRKAKAACKRRDKSPTSGGDIPDDIDYTLDVGRTWKKILAEINFL